MGQQVRRCRSVTLLMLGSLACASSEPEAATWQDEARSLLESGQPVEALAVYGRAAEEGHSPDADLEAARLLLSHQKVGWALESLRVLSAQFPSDPRVREMHYQAAILNRLFDEALSTGRQLLEWRPDDPRLLRHVGILELKAGRVEEAVEALRRSSEQDPDAPSTWYAMGRALEAGYREDEAIAAYRRRLELNADPLDTRWRLAHLLAQDDARLQEAEKLVAGLDAGPNPPARILHLLGSLRARLGRVEEGQRLLAEHARRAATEASRENDHLRYNVLLERAVVVLGEGATAEADRLLAEIARLPPSVQDERLALLRAESMLVQGKRTAALQELSLVVAARPLLWRYRYLRAEVLAALGLQQEALTELEAVDRLQPFAVDARRLRLRLLPADSPARRREASRLEVLEALLTADEPLLADGQRAPAATARTQLLFDAVQLHPRARLPEPDVIPMD